MKIGIIGTGTIASAIVTGFCKKSTGHTFFLSPRNADKASALALQFSEVEVCATNQEVLDNAEWVFITVQKSAFDALDELVFREDHKVLNMATEMRLDELKRKTGETKLLAHVCPLPMIAMGFGPLLVYPKTAEVGELFAPISDALYIENINDVMTLQLLTCMMSSYYMLLEEFVKFANSQGVSSDVSIRFVNSLFSALGRRAIETPNCDLVELAHDMTPGGYNEQAMKELMGNGAIEAWQTALNNLLDRLQANAKK